jgi:hypothetical protein
VGNRIDEEAGPSMVAEDTLISTIVAAGAGIAIRLLIRAVTVKFRFTASIEGALHSGTMRERTERSSANHEKD